MLAERSKDIPSKSSEVSIMDWAGGGMLAACLVLSFFPACIFERYTYTHAPMEVSHTHAPSKQC